MSSKAAALHHLTTESTLTTVTRELKYLWPFVAGLGACGYVFLKVGLSVTDEDVKNSKFSNPNKH
ncbi:hypothetical protein COCSUDRAFT_54105 [Coccomyxa subellipsoidea C-169]|uniref:Uncharacterized protein n=1 Tax=Coccomyxa subellipsoidea (strain C-169) TaxID=574566 RepID=I0YRP2_COCSC|nr:hypothetical protein COCSUDRAFT_54105 [Coccomyxa subellipsoidea C-169]EIE21061.1 hypothetical protein COCSUDRAFT_54105 [Coccomyxa subellipsoidea C-169]|eukprot:XP_005645605.1 hypothetical protein COCSUDRAFT_54105 [Coccomyxa subellipsoidea C-169]